MPPHWLALLIASAACGPAAVSDAPPPAPEPAADSAPPAAESPAAGLPTTSPDAVGMSADGLARIEPAVQAYVDDGRVASVMTMVARRGHVVHWAAAGMRNLAAGDLLEPDDIFRIYSMTKPITSVGVMSLVEAGAIALDDPVSKFIPAFADVTVLDDEGERVAPGGPITIEHLLTHTSGLTYGFFGDSPVDRLYNESGFFAQSEGLDDFAQRVAELPLLASPGERWNYGVSTDILGPDRRGGLRTVVRCVPAGADPRSARHGRYRVRGAGREAQPLHRELPALGRRASDDRLTGRRPIHAAAGVALGRRRARLHRIRLHPLRPDAP